MYIPVSVFLDRAEYDLDCASSPTYKVNEYDPGNLGPLKLDFEYCPNVFFGDMRQRRVSTTTS